MKYGVVITNQVSARDTEVLRTSCIARVGVSQCSTDVGRLGEVKATEVIITWWMMRMRICDQFSFIVSVV
jgi:hypothetical protein